MVTYFLHRYVLLFLFGHLIFSLWKLIELLANHRTACLTLLIYYFVYTRNSINFFKNSQISPSIKDIWFMFLKNSFRCVLFMYHLFSLLFDFVVFRMCTIYSTIYGWKTPFAYYFYFFFLWNVLMYMKLHVSIIFLICDNTFTVTMFYCLYVNVMETNKVRFNVAETEFRYRFNIFPEVYEKL